MEITEIDKAFISRYEQIDFERDLAKVRLILLGVVFVFSLIMIPINWNDEKFRGANNCVLILIVLIPFLFYFLYEYAHTEELFIKDLNMNETKAKYDFLKNEVGHFPFIQQICLLNPSAITRQLELLEKWYGVDISVVNTYAYDVKYDEKIVKDELDILNKKEFSVRMEFVHKLFKLAVVDDGIHIDEWNLLMDIMKQLKFNKNYVDFFIKRYGPLRTEFEDDESGENTSTKSIPVSQLKANYAILGLEEGASDVEIKRAYHNLALEHHPDLPKNAGRVRECEELMSRINEAYEKIRN